MQSGHPGLVGPSMKGRHVREPHDPSRVVSAWASRSSRRVHPYPPRRPTRPQFRGLRTRIQSRPRWASVPPNCPWGWLVSGAARVKSPALTAADAFDHLLERGAQGHQGDFGPGFQRRRCPQRTRPFGDGAPLQPRSWPVREVVLALAPDFLLEVRLQNFSLVGHALQGLFLRHGLGLLCCCFHVQKFGPTTSVHSKYAGRLDMSQSSNLQFSTFKIR